MDTTLYSRSNSRNGKLPSYSVSLDYAYEIDKKGSEFRTGVEYSQSSRSGDYYYIQTPIKGNIAQSNQIQRQDGSNQRTEFRADYTRKFGTAMKLEAGLYGSWQKRRSPSRTWNEMPDAGQLLIQYNDFDYEEWIGAHTPHTGQNSAASASRQDCAANTPTHKWQRATTKPAATTSQTAPTGSSTPPSLPHTHSPTTTNCR